MIHVTFTDRPGLTPGAGDIQTGPFDSIRYDNDYTLANGVRVAALIGNRNGADEVVALPTGSFQWSVGVNETHKGVRSGFVIIAR